MLKVHAKNLGSAKVLGLQGQMIKGETDTLRDVVHSLAETNGVILDLARVSRVDAHGLGVLLELREWTDKKGIAFELMNVSKPMRRMIEVARLDAVFEITVGVEFFPSVARQPRARMTGLRSVA